MNFFDHQDRARKLTFRLVVLFSIAVLLILAAVNAIAYGVLSITDRPTGEYEQVRVVDPVTKRTQWEWRKKPAEPASAWKHAGVYAAVSGITLLLILGSSAYKTSQLSSGGGGAVARMMGGRFVNPASAAGADRVLINVVEEMAIASGVPVPAVYVMDGESAVNAFAAGLTTGDAVIGVTRGLLERLNRDELQGVIAHEFSHILNGDMRMNVRLIGVLHGILILALIGYVLMRVGTFIRPSRDDKGGAAAIMVAMLGIGLLVMIVGYVGLLFGRMIQSAVSRQREFLADASAVQFTRNPGGIAGALKKIGGIEQGSKVKNANSMEVAHMMIANSFGGWLSGLLATHPPLEDRIRRIEPQWDGRFASASTTDSVAFRGESVAGRPERGWDPNAHAAQAAGFAGAQAGPSHWPTTTSSQPPPLPAQSRVQLDASDVVRHVGAPGAGEVTWAIDFLGAIPQPVVDAAHEPFSARAVVFALLLATDDAAARQRQLDLLQSRTDPTTYADTQRLADAITALGPAGRLPLLDLAAPALRQLSPSQVREFRAAVKELIEADGRVSLAEYSVHKILSPILHDPDGRGPRQPARFASLKAVMNDVVLLLTVLSGADQKDNERAQQAFAAGVRRLNPTEPVGGASDVSLSRLDIALARLAACTPGLKQRILDAAAHCVAADGTVQVEEGELLRAVAAATDCPLPPIVARGA